MAERGWAVLSEEGGRSATWRASCGAAAGQARGSGEYPRTRPGAALLRSSARSAKHTHRHTQSATRMDEIRKIPPVTRYLVGGTLAITLPILLKLVSIYPIVRQPVSPSLAASPIYGIIRLLISLVAVQVFIPRAITKDWEIWRLVTGFGFGGSGIGLLFDTFLLYRNSVDLEERHFQGRTASYGKPPWPRGHVGRPSAGAEWRSQTEPELTQKTALHSVGPDPDGRCDRGKTRVKPPASRSTWC